MVVLIFLLWETTGVKKHSLVIECLRVLLKQQGASFFKKAVLFKNKKFLREVVNFFDNNDGRFSPASLSIRPFLDDNNPVMGFDAHYMYHMAWAARMVRKFGPKQHVDISSHIYFSSQLSAWIPTTFYDFRVPKVKGLKGLTVEQADLCALKFETDSIDSLSCMHTIEHIGLGRYGDSIDSKGDALAAAELSRVLSPGGQLLIVVPVGDPKLEFNAQRIYSFEMVTSLFSQLLLKSFSLMPDDFAQTGFIENARPDLVREQRFGCGCFVFEKHGVN